MVWGGGVQPPPADTLVSTCTDTSAQAKEGSRNTIPRFWPNIYKPIDVEQSKGWVWMDKSL